MRKVLLLAKREYISSVKTKAFFVMMALMPIMMSGGMIVVAVMEAQTDTTDKRIAVLDHTGQIAEALAEAARIRNRTGIHDAETDEQTGPAYYIEIVHPNTDDIDAQRVALSDRVQSKQLHAFVEIGKDVIDPRSPPSDQDRPVDERITYHAPNAIFHDARRWMRYAIHDRIRDVRLAAEGLDREKVDRLFNCPAVEGSGLVTIDAAGKVKEAVKANKGRAIGVPAGMMFLMFMMVMVGAAPLVNAVLEEKMQRIAEVLLGSVKPFELMVGKLLGTVAVSFTVLAIYLAGGVGAVYYLEVQEYIPFEVLPWLVVYMIAAIFLFGSLLIGLGAACNDLKEAQSMMMPVWVLMMVPMMVWIQVAKYPEGAFATIMSLIPPFTPMLMLVRQSTPAGVPAWQPWVGLIGVALFTTLCVWGAGRIFRVGILMQGKPPSLVSLIRWAVRG